MKHLENYYEGKGCKCEARSSSECGCHDVDWTPKAVYELRAERDEAREKAERYRLDANALMLQRDDAREAFVIATDQMVIAQGKVREANKERDEARERHATEATEHMLAVNKVCNERDEAKEENAKLGDIATRAIPQLIELADGTKCVRLEDFLRERDEAQNEILGWKNKWECAVEMAARAGVERDKAMDALMRIEDLFIDGPDIYADRENMGMIAKAALEETK